MILYLSIFVIGGFAFMALWRYILIGVYWFGMALATIFAWRIVQLVSGASLDVKPIFIGGVSALVVCILCSGYIRHALILFYLREAIDKNKQAASKGRLW